MDVQEIRNARERATVVFTKFSLDYKGHEDYLFCFFEGEDSKYYGSRIEQHTGYFASKILGYNCGGRKVVERLNSLISQKAEYRNIKGIFFVDRDYCPQKEEYNNMYQTPCYSIENFYTTPECMGRILNREFGINSIDSDYEKCIRDYCSRYKEFHDCTCTLNAWLSCQRREEEKQGKKKIVLSDFKISKLFSNIDINSIVSKKTIDTSLLEEMFPNHYELSSEDLLADCDNFSNEEYAMMYRGKFELEFLKKILESLVSLNKEGTYFSRKYNTVNLNISSNLLSSLSSYAETPRCLIDFLEKYNCQA